MSPARMSSPGSVDTRVATRATEGRSHMPMSPAATTVAVRPLGSALPPPPPPDGPDGDAHAVAVPRTAIPRTASNRYFIALGQLYHTWYRFATVTTMSSPTAKAGKVDRMVLSPQEPLVTGGPAEELERRIQETFKAGYE